MSVLSELNAWELAGLETAGEIITRGRLKIYYFETGGTVAAKPAVKIWRGKAKRHFVNYRFRDESARDAYVAEQIRNDEAAEQRRAENKFRQQRFREEMRAAFQVGTLLHYSWGYEQTNCDFFQVVERRGAYAMLREIGSRVVEASEAYMSDRRMPARDTFIGKPIRKLIGPYGISMDHGCCSPCGDNDQFYCSWYH